jgi:hypothetical protein
MLAAVCSKSLSTPPAELIARPATLMTALLESQAEGGMGFRVKVNKDKQVVVKFIRPPTDLAAASSHRVRELLGLNPDVREFRVESGSVAEDDREIAILTRSILQVMIDIASSIEVPAADIAEGSVFSPQRSVEQERMFPALLTVRHGAAPPDNAYVAIPYRRQGFWVDDRDQRSKQILSFLMLMFSLTEGAPSQSAPVVTIPAR